MTFDLPSASYKATCPGGSLSSPLLNGRIVRDNATMVNNIGQNDVSFTTSAFHKGLDFRIYVGASTWNNVLYPMVRASEDDNTFEPYKGNTYEIALGLTVYGGKLDVLSGELTVTHDYIASYSGQTLPGEWISDRAVYAAGTTPPIGAQVVYELATPTSYELTPPTITTLLGINNIWADCGEVAVKYPRDIMTRAEVQRMIDAAIYGAIGGSY